MNSDKAVITNSNVCEVETPRKSTIISDNPHLETKSRSGEYVEELLGDRSSAMTCTAEDYRM
jgi:hypothetical protein